MSKLTELRKNSQAKYAKTEKGRIANGRAQKKYQAKLKENVPKENFEIENEEES